MSEPRRIYEHLEGHYGANRPRPLAHLNKRQLFAYTLADTSDSAAYAFSQEILHRRKVHSTTTNALTEAMDALRRAEDRLKRARNEQELAALTKQRDACDVRIVKAKISVDGLADDNEALSHEEVQKFYSMRYRTAYDALLNKYKMRELFKCQYSCWGEFLMKPKEREADDKAFSQILNFAELVGATDTPDFREIRAMFLSRILPSVAYRQRFTSDKGDLIPVASMPDQTRMEYWKAWHLWHRETIHWDWIDSAGVAETAETLQDARDQKAAAEAKEEAIV